jgi:hypothetical protein
MPTKQGKDLDVGDRVIRLDGQAMTIKRLTQGMCRDSRIAEYDRTDEWGRLWGSVFNKTQYEIAESAKK